MHKLNLQMHSQIISSNGQFSGASQLPLREAPLAFLASSLNVDKFSLTHFSAEKLCSAVYELIRMDKTTDIALEKHPQGDTLGCVVEQKQTRMTNIVYVTLNISIIDIVHFYMYRMNFCSFIF